MSQTSSQEIAFRNRETGINTINIVIVVLERFFVVYKVYHENNSPKIAANSISKPS